MASRTSSSLLFLLLVRLVSPAFAIEFSNPFAEDGIISKIFSKDGAGTKMIEALPGGGYATAPFHLLAGHRAHALRAAVAGTASLTALVVSGPPGAIVTGVAITAVGLTAMIEDNQEAFNGRRKREAEIRVSRATLAGAAIGRINPQHLYQIFEESGLNLTKGAQAGWYQLFRDSRRAGELLLEAMDEKISENAEKLSAESGGRRTLKSVKHHTYLTAKESEWAVAMFHRPAPEMDHWYIEDWRGKVVLKARGAPHKPGQFLSANSNGTVNLVREHPKDKPSAIWTPFKNEDESWSFLSIYGSFLSAHGDGSVSTVVRCRTHEKFRLGWW